MCGTALSSQNGAVVGVLTPPPAVGSTTIGGGETRVPLPDGITVASTGGDAVTRVAAGDGLSGAHVPAFVAGRTIADRYHIIRLLGVGGMGAVYQAWDEKLGVAVALKVILNAGAGSTPGATETLERRFKRELILARQVTHKNVVRIHDLGEIDGTLYITMPYVQGSNLAAVLATEGKLAIPRALTIARQVASGLTAAHDAGVIHRDLKPANIMIEADDERALIMDFGIARSTSSSEGTRTAAIVGTLEYMAPEQAEGRSVDQRCDVYALGLILYDMLGGSRPVGASAVADLMARLQNPLPSIRTVNAAVPEPLAEVVDRCLQRDPGQRYQTSTELVAALDVLDNNGLIRPGAAPQRLSRVLLWSMAAVIAALAVGLIFLGRRGGPSAAPPVHEPVSVLIADFENRANDPVFDGSVEQALTIGVEGASFITTMPRRDAHRLATQVATGKLDESAATLISVREGVKFVVAGSIESEGGGYKISARVIDPAVGKAIKTETTHAKSKADVLQAVGTLAADVRRDLGDTTSESARRSAMETFTASSLDAVREYTLAQDLAVNSKYEESIPHYRKAIEADANFGRAYSGWATAAFELGRSDEANELWKKALSLMDRMTDRERYRTLGLYYLAVARNYDQAIENYTKLVERYPADVASHNNLAVAYFNKLNFPKAMEEGRKAVEIYKRSFKFRNNYVLYAMYAGDFTTAEQRARDLIREDPKFSDAYFPLAIALIAKGDPAGARTAYQQMAENGSASRAAIGLADLALYEGRYAEAEAILNRGIAQDAQNRNGAGLSSKQIALAETQLALGKPALALDAARKALAVTRNESTAVAAARVFMAAGRAAEAKALAADLAKELQTQSRAYASIIEGEIALAENRVNDAVDAFRSGSRQLDVWLSHYDLGLAYVRASHPAEAIAEFDTATKRRGEATALFLDDIPSYRYLAALPYWLARAQEGVGMKTAAVDNYKAFLSIRPDDSKDPLAIDARKRITP